jgi:isopenicillin N synthase-like dioxygenase
MNDAIPVIDIAPLRAPDPAARAAVAAALGQACREVGFFYATGHEMSAEMMDGVFAASRQFFALDLAAKRDLAMRRVGNNRGYVEMEHERLDPAAPPDRKETFNIGLELAPDDPEVNNPFRGANAWPALPGFRDTMLSYYQACHRLGCLIHQGFSLDLGLPEHFFADKLDKPIASLRLLRYPASPGADPGAPGAGTHTDYGNLTILAVEGVAGLQVRRRDGVWLDAPHIPGAFVCNIGDCLMRWSNDIYISTPHRVVVPRQERYSIAFFLDPNPDAPVVPVALRPGERAKYPPTTGAAFLQSRLAPTYSHIEPVLPAG